MKARDSDQLASVYDAEVCDIFVRDRRKVSARWLQARCLLRGRKTLLDVGCGIGSFAKDSAVSLARKPAPIIPHAC